MKGFEPIVNPFVTLPIKTDQTEALHNFSDVDLLLELRRRKVLARVDYHNVAPGYAVSSGYPLDVQIRKAYEGLADQLNRAHHADRQPLGCKLETGNFIHKFYDREHPDRKVTLVLNYVVDFKL
jgi:hypothetical protein